jgi:hypothetical protein
LLDRSAQEGNVVRIDIEDDVAALDVGDHIGVAEPGMDLAEGRHRHGSVAADVDAASNAMYVGIDAG